MTFELKLKNKKILFVVACMVLTFGFLLSIYWPVVLQEGSHWSEIKTISRLVFGGADMVKFSGSNEKYLTKSQGGSEAIDEFMKDRGYTFTNRMGSGYLYKYLDKTIVLTRRQYSRFYAVWTVPETVSENKEDLAKELKECLPKSDASSHEKCNELLKKINDYESCVGAGFSIMKSNPPQCATPDGRTFIE